jgi:hypothetical protein
MRRVCAWCQKPLDSNPRLSDPVTHGICDRCLRIVLTRAGIRPKVRLTSREDRAAGSAD